MSDEVVLAISTFPDAETAKRIATQLVEARLAACANIGMPGESIYRWEGKLESAQEGLVFFKTTHGRFSDLMTTIKALHPYDVPEIICVDVTNGFPAYLRWVEDSCAPPLRT